MDRMSAADTVGDAAWSRYWAAGHAHSCPTSFAGFYGPQLQEFWRRQAAGLGAGDTVLDLGCGNGALLRFLASQFPPERAPALVGVDVAELRPDWLAAPEARRVTLHAHTRFEALPLASASVTLAASLFGIEYGSTDAAWAELFRVLRPRARCAFVLHKRGSRLDVVAADEVTLGGAALAADGPLARATELVPYLGRAATAAGRIELRGNRDAELARERFNAATQALVNLAGLVKHGDYAHDILRALMRVLGDAGATAPRIAELRRGVEDHVTRIEALRRSALDVAALGALRQRLQEAGFALTDVATIAEQGFEMGWAVEGTRGNTG
jgi:SAM-dependent methyltransferase